MESVREIVAGDKWLAELAALNVCCPKCFAAPKAECFENGRWIDPPHPERVEAAKQQNLFA